MTTNIGDVMAASSSRGPTQDKTLKPDVVAPGVDIISSGYAVGDYPIPFSGFGSSSGTSMASPHVAGAAALLVDAHPNWSPAHVKSALMTTATEDVFIDTAQAVPAGVLDRGAGRIDVAAAVDPGLVFNVASLSGGETAAGESVSFTVRGRNVGGAASTWNITTEADDGLTITPSASTVTADARGGVTLDITVESAADAEAGDYEGSVILTNPATGQRLHMPVWLGVRPSPTVDVLLVDDDGSSVPGFADYAGVYEAALDAAGVSYDYLDVWNEGFPAAIDLYQYRAVVIFTGDNDSFDTSGFTLGNHDALAEWLDSGGRLWLSGQNQAETTDDNTNSSPNQGRGRIYHGYAGLRYEDGDIYGDAAAPTPTANGAGFLAGMQLDLGPNGDGIDNQDSIEAASAFDDNDTYQAAHTNSPLFLPIGGDAPPGSAIAFSRGSEPSLEEERVMFRYRTISMGFGLEGVNGAPAQAVAGGEHARLAAVRSGGRRERERGRAGSPHRDVHGHADIGRRCRPVPVGLRRRFTDRHHHRADGDPHLRRPPQLQRPGGGDRLVRPREHHPHPGEGGLTRLRVPQGRFPRRTTSDVAGRGSLGGLAAGRRLRP